MTATTKLRGDQYYTGNIGALKPVADKLNGGGVSEPAFWAMMLEGFGGMGVLIRRRRFTRSASAKHDQS